MQWEERLDKLKVAAHQLGYERGQGTNLDLPGRVETFDEHYLTEDEMRLWRVARKSGYAQGRRSKRTEDIAKIDDKINKGEPLTAADETRLEKYQKWRERENRLQRERRRRTGAARESSKPSGESSKPSVKRQQSSKPSVKQQRKQGSRKSLRLQESAAKGKLKS
jgi:hypothetical protein